MNDTMIENILFHAPSPVAPPGLLKRLQAGIALPRTKSEPRAIGNWQNPLRRWFPALAFSVVLLSCAIMIAVQGNWSASLKQQNETLRAAAAGLPQLREQHAAFEKAQAQQDELAQLRKDNQEVHQLQAQVSQLQSLAGQVQRLQDENRRLISSLNAPAPSNGNATFFDEAQQRAERIQCCNNLKQLGLAMRIWAGDNDGKYPTSLVVMSNELSIAKILICPSDKARAPYATLGWSEFQDNMTSYDYLAQSDDERYPQCITAMCPIHHNYLFSDGSVQQINPEKVHEVKKGGRLYLEPINPNSTP
ncbi:MAG TPA: hypothetical protein VH597_10385 [Verrucomicrobiae bacterium]|jgi:hypothetical protein|nr:hypothetical protein [Verrucomicrobiae bacterium]